LVELAFLSPEDSPIGYLESKNGIWIYNAVSVISSVTLLVISLSRKSNCAKQIVVICCVVLSGMLAFLCEYFVFHSSDTMSDKYNSMLSINGGYVGGYIIFFYSAQMSAFWLGCENGMGSICSLGRVIGGDSVRQIVQI
jgi:hypothetical protein